MNSKNISLKCLNGGSFPTHPKKGIKAHKQSKAKNNTIVQKSLKFVVGRGGGGTHCCFAQPTTAKPLGFFLGQKRELSLPDDGAGSSSFL